MEATCRQPGRWQSNAKFNKVHPPKTQARRANEPPRTKTQAIRVPWNQNARALKKKRDLVYLKEPNLNKIQISCHLYGKIIDHQRSSTSNSTTQFLSFNTLITVLHF